MTEAFALIQFAIEKTEKLLTREWNFPEKVNTDIRNLKDELDMMTAYLKQTDERGELDHQTLACVRKVQDQAHQIDNVLDKFSYHVAEKAAKWYSKLGANRYTKWRADHVISDMTDAINNSLKNMKEIRERYPIANNIIYSQDPGTSSAADLHQRMAPLFLPNAELVGFDEERDVLMSRALDEQETYKIMFVVGMGGSGKTALVRQVFEAVKKDFDCHAWITVSRPKTGDILSNLLGELCNSRAEPAPQLSFSSADLELELIKKLKEYLQDKRYLIGLDDLWIDNTWKSIMFAFPRANSSRIFITTRRADIAYSHKNESIEVRNIPHLSPEPAEKLFHMKAFPKTRRCPPALAGWSDNILRKCGGLPLAIIEIGQFLSSKRESESEWRNLHDDLVSELRSNGHLSNITRVLISSYNDLPYHLKHCFLFMNIFPPNYHIQCRKLIQLWIAEGFINGKNNRKELEDIGEGYLTELIERSLIQVSKVDIDGIQVSKVDIDGRPRTCTVHRIMQEIALSKIQDENFCEVCPEQRIISVNDKTRRISIHKSEIGPFNWPNIPASSLLIFGSRTPYHHIGPIPYSSLNFLKVLHLEGAPLDTFPEGIEQLLFLRYLCLRKTRIKSIPKFIGKLRHLETLDLKHTYVSKLPKEMCHLNKLRNLLVCRYNYDIGNSVSFNTVEGFEMSSRLELKNLRKLSFVQVQRDRQIILAMGDLKKLRKLGILDLCQKDGRSMCETIQKLTNLYSLNVTAKNEEEILDMQEMEPSPPLQRLYLKGCLKRMPLWISKLQDLVRIRLKWSRLTPPNNPLEILQGIGT
ncbi:hypothetical protein ACH5RR_016008 [Cinchona calisaya]|uniref:Uncharacterized protein n=1 Tax=Cinchona calisaya TaxID=153742 RepID=A0ABD2ZVN3_9GENT